MSEFGIPTKLLRLTRLTPTNVPGQIKAAGSLLRPLDTNNGLTQGDARSYVFWEAKVIRDADVNARGTILFKSTQLLTYADDIDIMGRTTRNVLSLFIQIEQAARDLGLHIDEGKAGSHAKTIKIENCYYLGSKITTDNSYDDEIRARLLAANRAYFS